MVVARKSNPGTLDLIGQSVIPAHLILHVSTTCLRPRLVNHDPDAACLFFPLTARLPDMVSMAMMLIAHSTGHSPQNASWLEVTTYFAAYGDLILRVAKLLEVEHHRLVDFGVPDA